MPAGFRSPDGDDGRLDGKRYDVFVVSSAEDRAWVHGYLLDALEQASVTSCDVTDFELGRPRLEEMQRLVQQSRRVVAVFSRAFTADAAHDFLLALAQDWGQQTQTWPLIPVLLDDVELPPRVRMLERLDLRDPQAWKGQIERLAAALDRPLGPARPIPPCPYPGMRAYRADEAGRFVGRKREAEVLVDRLRLSPRICVLGPSGGGKSSLVLAGLASRLHGHPAFDGDPWRLHHVRPGADPLARIAASVGLEPTVGSAEIAEHLARIAQDERRLVVVDQLEELFSDGRDHGDEDLAALLSSIERSERVRTVLTLRADFYAQLMESPLWRLLAPYRFEVLPLRGERLREAIVEPAERTGVFVEPALVERLVSDSSGEPGMLPFLQETMRMLWGRIERRLITLDGYEALVLPESGYPSKSRNGLLVALSRHADGVLARLDDDQKVIARRILVRLVQFGEGRTDVRRQQRRAHLRADEDPDRFDETLATLSDGRLVTTGSEPLLNRGASDQSEWPARDLAPGGVVTVDLAHESMITGWSTLAAWVDEQRAAELVRRRLMQTAQEWQRLGRTTGGLLDDVQLGEAERWLDDPATAAVGVDQPIRELIERSRRRRDETHRRRQRLRMALAVLTAATAVLAMLATVNWRLAERETDRAQSLLLASRSRVGTDDSAVAGLLALEALRRAPTVEARGALLDSLIRRHVKLLRRLNAGDQPLLTVTAAPEADLIAAAGQPLPTGGGPDIVVWRLSSAEVVAELSGGHTDEITAVTLSPDGTTLAAAGRDDRVTLWNLQQAELERTFRSAPVELPDGVTSCRAASDSRFGADVRAVSFDPTGRVLAAAGHDQLVRLWNLEDGSEHRLSGHLCDVMDVAWHPDGDRLATVGRDDTLRVWSVHNRTQLRSYGTPDGSPRSTSEGRTNPSIQGDLRAVEWSPDGSRLAYAGNDGRVGILDSETFEEVQPPTLVHTERIFDVAFSPDGHEVASGGRDGVLAIRSVEDGSDVARIDTGPRAIAWPSNDRLLTVNLTPAVHVWEPHRRVPLAKELRAAGDTSIVGAIRAGGELIGATEEGGVVVWTGGATTAVGEPPESLGAATALVAINDERVAVGHQSGHVSEWTVDEARHVHTRQVHDDPVAALALAKPTSHLVTATRQGELRLWPADSDAPHVAEVQIPGCTVLSVAAHPVEPGLLAISCNETDTLRVWRAESGHIEVAHRGGRLREVRFDDTGGLLFGASINGDTRVWRILDGGRTVEPVAVLATRAEEIRAVATDPTRPRIVTGSADGRVQLWDVATRAEIGPAWRVPTPVRQLSFAPDGARVAVTAGAAAFEINVDEESWRDAACRRAGRSLTPLEWQQFVGEGAVEELCPASP